MWGNRTQTTELKMILVQSSGTKSAILHDVADRHLHPAVVDHDPERRKRRPQRHHRGREQIEPRRHTGPAEKKDAEKTGFQHEGRECLVGEQRPLNRPRHLGQHAPVRAELECHHDSRDDAQAERDAEYLEPELEQHPVDRAAGLEMQRLEHGEPGGQPDREGREDDVERDRERELNSRQKKSRGVHRKASCLVPEIRPPWVDQLPRRDH